jgi:rSAM/selenodomain-associated transferase 2
MKERINKAPWLSIILPTLNEASVLASTLQYLQPARNNQAEIIVVDGGSTDGTLEIACTLADMVLRGSRGRAVQMNHGARHAKGTCLLFLHADTQLPADAPRLLKQEMDKKDDAWGRFDIRLSGNHRLFRVIEFLINQRSRMTGIATGDQCIFVRPELFWQVGGYSEIPIMEDIALSKSLGEITPPVCLGPKATTSSRRWEQNGVVRTIFVMWSLRLFYFLGVKPEALSRWYR